MCGLAGFLDRSDPAAGYELSAVATRMADTMLSRGPDDSGVWADPEVGLGFAHRRLAVIDLSAGGHQPMVSSNGRYVLVYNGEIYNFKELAAELQADGCAFRGNSDSEVLLEACAVWGTERAVPRLIGMFAFGLWDRKQRTLTLVRDRLGVKPLYFATFEKLFLFGSELKALRAHPGFEARVDPDAVAAYLRLNYIPAPNSIYRNVYKLEPGCMLHFSAGQAPRISRYWDMREVARSGAADPLSISDEEALERLESILCDAVRGRMIADVPLGAFLSGGIDSSAVLAMMQKCSDRPVRSFTIGFHESKRDESIFAKEVAQHIGTEHTELLVEPSHVFETIPRLPEWYDEPFADSSQIPTFLLSQMTRRDVTVSLSGDGGDELFAGYNWYAKAKRLALWVERIPRRLRRPVSGALELAVGPLEKMPWRMSGIAKKCRRFAGSLTIEGAGAQHRLLMSRWDDPLRLVPGARRESASVLWDETVADDLPDIVQRMQFLDTVTYLPDDILTKVDRASMAVSLEVRVPLLDHRVVEFVWSLPGDMKIRDGKTKWLLRQLVYKYVPRRLIERPKMGFGVPLDEWLRGPLRDWAEELLSEDALRSGGLLLPGPVRQKWQEHINGTYNWRKQLWSVLMLQAWHRHWM